jgi:molecular chaperone IbpA
MNQLVRIDTNALNKAFVGFDSLFDHFEQRFANQIHTNYPPHNIVKFDDDNYEIQIAVSGFEKEEVTVEVADNHLTIKGEHVDVESVDTVYLHRGLAARNFTRVFPLAEHIVVGKAVMKNGILKIALQRVLPEALKPRVIDIVEVK